MKIVRAPLREENIADFHNVRVLFVKKVGELR